MNPNFSASFIALFFAVALLSLFYTFVAKPVLRDWLRFKLFAIRDEIRDKAISGELPPGSFNHTYLERTLCRWIDRCYWYSWSSFIEFVLRRKNQQVPHEAKRFSEKAPEDLKKLLNKTMCLMAFSLVINSPIFSATVLCSVGLAQLFGKAWKKWLELKTAIFFQEPLNVIDPNGCLQTT